MHILCDILMHILIKKCLNHCKSLWIKASAKCINVNIEYRDLSAYENNIISVVVALSIAAERL